MQIEFRRGSFVESSHNILARVQNSKGEVLYETPEVDSEFFPRSSVKPLQARLLVAGGAYESFKLTWQHVAIACASHSGQKDHTELVRNWLESLSLSEGHLQCGPHWPFDPESSTHLKEMKVRPTRIHNNCSGKHTGFLCVCLQHGWPLENYHLAEHPLQLEIKEGLEKYFGLRLKDYGIDGCSIPAYRMNFASVAEGFAKMASEVNTKSDAVTELIYKAFTAHPMLTAGREEYCTQVMEANAGRLLVKEGAEGVVSGAIPEKNLSILVKAHDGAERAAQAAFDILLEKFTDLKPAYPRKLRNWGGVETGDIHFRL